MAYCKKSYARCQADTTSVRKEMNEDYSAVEVGEVGQDTKITSIVPVSSGEKVWARSPIYQMAFPNFWYNNIDMEMIYPYIHTSIYIYISNHMHIYDRNNFVSFGDSSQSVHVQNVGGFPTDWLAG